MMRTRRKCLSLRPLKVSQRKAKHTPSILSLWKKDLPSLLLTRRRRRKTTPSHRDRGLPSKFSVPLFVLETISYESFPSNDAQSITDRRAKTGRCARASAAALWARGTSDHAHLPRWRARVSDLWA